LEALHYPAPHRTLTRRPADYRDTVGFEEAQQFCVGH
jgi:hypothetical protein